RRDHPPRSRACGRGVAGRARRRPPDPSKRRDRGALGGGAVRWRPAGGAAYSSRPRCPTKDPDHHPPLHPTPWHVPVARARWRGRRQHDDHATRPHSLGVTRPGRKLREVPPELLRSLLVSVVQILPARVVEELTQIPATDPVAPPARRLLHQPQP